MYVSLQLVVGGGEKEGRVDPGRVELGEALLRTDSESREGGFEHASPERRPRKLDSCDGKETAAMGERLLLEMCW